MKKQITLILAFMVLAAGCAVSKQGPTTPKALLNGPVGIDTPTDTITETITVTGTETATNTPTDTPTLTPTDTPTNTPTNSPTVTKTPSPTPTVCGFTADPVAVPYIDPTHWSGTRAVSITWNGTCKGFGQALVSYYPTLGGAAKFQDPHFTFAHTVTQNFQDRSGRWYELSPNRTYYYAIQTLNADGVVVVQSAVFSFTTLP